MNEEVVMIEVERITSELKGNLDQETLKELADSIAQHGVIEPILVEKDGDTYRVIAGIRRFLAAKLAGLKEVPVTFRQ